MIVSCLAVFMQFAAVRSVENLQQPIAVYGYGFAMAVFSTVIPAFLLAAAIHRIGASHTSMIGALGPVATIEAVRMDKIVRNTQPFGERTWNTATPWQAACNPSPAHAQRPGA